MLPLPDRSELFKQFQKRSAFFKEGMLPRHMSRRFQKGKSFMGQQTPGLLNGLKQRFNGVRRRLQAIFSG